MATIKKISPINLWHLAFAIIGVESQWTRGTSARNKQKQACAAISPLAKCWCSAGVIRKLTEGRDPRAVAHADFVLRNALDAAALQHDPKLSGRSRVRPFITLNDGATHATVVAMWQAAREVLLKRPDQGRV